MKKTLFYAFFCLSSYFAYADGSESICVITNTGNNGEWCTPSQLGFVNPCNALAFVVRNLTPPSGFVIVAKFEWFVNDVLVKTTTDPTDPVLAWQIVLNPTHVYCKVTYKKNDGTLSSPYTSTTFTPLVRSFNIGAITTSTPPPNYGCGSTVSYSLNTYTCTQFCDFTYNVSEYSITWQPPSGWTQTSISTNGNDVSFTPDATTGGTLTATITMPCGYSETRTFAINRVAASPTFVAGNPTNVCTSSGTFSIDPVCGASSYTYSLSGSPGITFASNGLQTLTTTSTSVTLSLSGSPSTNSLKAKANYPGNFISSETNTDFNYGAVPTSQMTTLLIDPVVGKIQVEAAPVLYAQSYNWYKDGISVVGQHGNVGTIPITKNRCDVGYGIEVEVINGCGTSSKTYKGVYVPPCDGFYMLSPNPSSNEVTVTTDQTRSATEQKTFSEIRIYDLSGNLKKLRKYDKVKSANIIVSDLGSGNYTVQIVEGNYIESKTLIIQK